MTARDKDCVEISIDVRKVLAIMPEACVVYGCNNISDIPNGIGLHRIPFFGDSRPECVKRRKKWVDFVLRRRANWVPARYSSICSKHFGKDCFQQLFSVPGQRSPQLLQDTLGKCVYPTIQANDPEYGSIQPQSDRAKRKVRKSQTCEFLVKI